MHRWSELFIPTLREVPADAEVPSHKFLVRAGYIRQLAAGIYSYLFLGNRSFNKIVAIVRQEMDRIGQEFYLPALHPREIWEASGRWGLMGDNLFRLKDRKGADMCLGMTEEEVMTSIALKELRSYKQLPQIWYQIAPKFRDEPRPRSGLLRVRQFMMKDSYSFDIDAAGLDVSYRKHYDAYCRIFDRCGLKYMVVEADSGAMGGKESHEFMVRTEAGEDEVASCPRGHYVANTEKATSRLAPVEGEVRGNKTPAELIPTPGKRTIAEVSEFLGAPANQLIKSVVYMGEVADPAKRDAKERPKEPFIIMALVRGDHDVQEAKMSAALAHLNLMGVRPASSEETDSLIGPHGFIGPRDLPLYAGNRLQVLLDSSLAYSKNLICGANKPDYHMQNVTPIADFPITNVVDIQKVNVGDPCPVAGCGAQLEVGKAVEVGHIFKLGYRYSQSMGARVLDSNGKEVMPIMGSYGIGIERILTAAVEQGNDEDGFWLPAAIAPFAIVVSPVNVKDQAVKSAAEDIARRLEAAGFDVILDDRDERPGVKFKDADLVGIPFRITVGKKVTEGTVEVVLRSTRAVSDVTITAIVQHFQALLGPAG
jgi:prolyl-tRNA synthetase